VVPERMLPVASIEMRETIKHNVDELNRRGVRTLITNCGSCYYYLGMFYPVFARWLNLDYPIKVKHVTEVISELMDEGKLKLKFPVKMKATFTTHAISPGLEKS